MIAQDLIKVSDDTFILASEVRQMMIEFAKNKVIEALEAASNKATTKSFPAEGYPEAVHITVVDKESILESYKIEDIV